MVPGPGAAGEPTAGVQSGRDAGAPGRRGSGWAITGPGVCHDRAMHGRRLLVGLACAATVACAGTEAPAPPPAAPAASGAALPSAKAVAPPLEAATAADVLARVNASKGKVVLVNVWATWCIPCRQEMPDLLEVRQELGPRGLELLLVSADFDSEIDAARAFLGTSGVTFPTLHKKQPDQAFIDGLDPSWSGALPCTVVFGRDGARATSWEGKQDHDGLVARLTPLLDAARNDSKGTNP